MMKKQVPWGTATLSNVAFAVILMFTAWGASVPIIARKLAPRMKVPLLMKRPIIYIILAITMIILVFLFQLFGYKVRGIP